MGRRSGSSERTYHGFRDRTVLPDRRRPANNERGLAGVLGLASLLPRSGNIDSARFGMVGPKRTDRSSQAKWDGRGLLKCNIVRNLGGGISGVVQSGRLIYVTLAVLSAEAT